MSPTTLQGLHDFYQASLQATYPFLSVFSFRVCSKSLLISLVFLVLYSRDLLSSFVFLPVESFKTLSRLMCLNLRLCQVKLSFD